MRTILNLELEYGNSRLWLGARIVAGNIEVGKKFLAVAHNFVFQEKFEYNSLIEISRLRERIEIELAQEKTKGKNVKLGFGGIADIEFVMQILQLIHGKKNPRLRETNTIEAINKFVEHGMIDQFKAEKVKENYLFLRNLECALRIIGVTPSNNLPKDTSDLAQLGRLMSYEGSDTKILANNLLNDYEKHTTHMREYYRDTIGQLLRTGRGSVSDNTSV